MSQSLSSNSLVSHYRIVSKLGAGGSGEVYLAEDIKLDRKVALKLLPAGVATNEDRMARFVREAKSAAALNHPNIAPSYAQAWVALADGCSTPGYSGFKPAADVMPNALEAARRALELDPKLAEAHMN